MKKGFTLVELVVVIALIIVTGAVVFSNLAGRRSTADLTATTQQVGALLRQAQSDAMEQESDVAWGVHLANTIGTPPFYALFTTSYSTGTIVGKIYLLPSTVSYTTSTLAAGATLDVIFSPVSGMSSASTSIGFYMPQQSATFSSTISISPSGEISY